MSGSIHYVRIMLAINFNSAYCTQCVKAVIPNQVCAYYRGYVEKLARCIKNKKIGLRYVGLYDSHNSKLQRESQN